MDNLPVNLDAERFVLGLAVSFDEVQASVLAEMRAEDFSLSANRVLAGVLLEMWGAGKPVDRVTVCDELMRVGKLEEIGGLGYLVALDDGLPIAYNWRAYLDTVADKAALRRLMVEASRIQAEAAHAESADDALAAAQARLGAIASDVARRDGGAETVEQVILRDGFEALMGPPPRPHIEMPWPSVRRYLPYMAPGDLVLIAARPGAGKSVMGAQIAAHVARSAGPVVMFGLEMTRRETVRRLVASEARINPLIGLTGGMGAYDPDERVRIAEGAARVASLPFYLVEGGRNTPQWVEAECSRLRARVGQLALVVVDYLQLLTSDRRREKSYEDVSDVSRAMKLLAGKIGAPVLALSQLTRDVDEKEEPSLHHLRGSGSLEQDANAVVMLQLVESQAFDRRVVRVHVKKNRAGAGGPGCRADLWFRPVYSRFDEIETVEA